MQLLQIGTIFFYIKSTECKRVRYNWSVSVDNIIIFIRTITEGETVLGVFIDFKTFGRERNPFLAWVWFSKRNPDPPENAGLRFASREFRVVWPMCESDLAPSLGIKNLNVSTCHFASWFSFYKFV